MKCPFGDVVNQFAQRYRLYLQDSQWRFFAFITVLVAYGSGIYYTLIRNKYKLYAYGVSVSVLVEVAVACLIWM